MAHGEKIGNAIKGKNVSHLKSEEVTKQEKHKQNQICKRNVRIEVKSKSKNFVLADKLNYKEADSNINYLLQLLEKTPSDNFKILSQIHLELMDVYYKNRNFDPHFFSNSTYHAREAFINGDTSGKSAYRLISNLSKEEDIHLALEVCEIVTDPAYHFSHNAISKKPEFIYKLKKLKRKIHSEDKKTLILFNPDQVKKIMKNSSELSNSKINYK